MTPEQPCIPRPAEPARTRLPAALAAGFVAITINTGLLVLADALHFTTARGGLLRLVKSVIGGIAGTMGGWPYWTEVLAPATTGAVARSAFHMLVGMLMAVFYAYCVDPVLKGGALTKGLLYALGVWLLNALAVLPLIGQGIAGSNSLGAAGMIGFAVIHTVFFVLLALIYARLRRRSTFGAH